ncbi:unnamed protein product [Alternaria alternata]
MARFFSSSARALAKWLGFDRNKLPSHWKSAVEKFAAPGGAAEQKLGLVQTVEIKYYNFVKMVWHWLTLLQI